MRTLMWFRSDLRTRDNSALSAATRAATRGVIGLFVVSPGEWREHDVAPVKVDFVLRTLRVLSADLATLNIPLVIRTAATSDDVAVLIASLARRHSCDAVYWNKEYEVDERRRDERTEAMLRGAGVRAFAMTDQSLIEPGEVRTKGGGEGRLYTVFTPFKRAALAYLASRGGVTEREPPKRQASMPGGVSIDQVPSAINGFESTIPSDKWPAGERHARTTLRAFVESKMDRYAESRDFPGQPGTSTLSPYLAIGAISPRACLAEAVEAIRSRLPAGANPLDTGSDGKKHWISEVLWREFYIHITAGFPRVCMGRAFQPATEAIRWRTNDEHFERWKSGRTGVPIVDAGMRQLTRVGWMHNRVRMIAAMYLTKNLFLDWRLGERWFMQNLVDGFFASNNGGWQWSASTGTDAAPYFRVFNPVAQSERFDPQGEYIRRFVPELSGVAERLIHDPSRLPPLHRGQLSYPEPLVDLSRSRKQAIDSFRALRA